MAQRNTRRRYPRDTSPQPPTRSKQASIRHLEEGTTTKGTLHIYYPLIAKFISPLVGRSDLKTASHQLCITRNNSTNVAPQTPYRYQSNKEPCLGLLSFINLFLDPDHDQKVYFAFNPKLLRFLLRPRTRRPRVYPATSGRYTLCLRGKTFDSSARLH